MPLEADPCYRGRHQRISPNLERSFCHGNTGKVLIQQERLVVPGAEAQGGSAKFGPVKAAAGDQCHVLGLPSTPTPEKE